ncbi:MAG: AAA family ATPase [Armatimonadetes bacterium]|nr:AAA family ATPase [Armatimonadota bacterium]
MNNDSNRPMFETSLRASGILEEILRMLPLREHELRQYLMVLRHQLEVDERQFEEAQEALLEYDEAYQKLTSPANRVATFLGHTDDDKGDLANIALGDGDFLSNFDPKGEFDPQEFKVGTRVKVNDAYAVLGDLGYPMAGPIVKIISVLEDGRLRVSMDSQGMNSRVVMRSSELEFADLKEGDEIRMDPNFRVALEHFPVQRAKEYFLDTVPELPWSKVGGQKDAIRLIRDTIERPLLYPELYKAFNKKPLKGILLYGPPGCGKTLIGKATAYNLTQEYRERTQQDVKEYFMAINGPKILNMYLGETERMVREIFQKAREKAKEGYLVFLFIDEAESILRTRSSGRYLNISNTVVPQFCAEMDGLESLQNVVVMLTSNRPDYIDPAVLRPERIDRKVKVNRPDRDASREILSIYLTPDLPLDPHLLCEVHEGDREAARQALIDGAMEVLWRRGPETEFLQVHLRNGGVETLYWKDLTSGAILASIVERAKDLAIRRAIEEGKDAGLRIEDLQESVRMEYKENEIFPKTDIQEDWLKLLDYEPENVASVKPIRPDKSAFMATRNAIV